MGAESSSQLSGLAVCLTRSGSASRSVNVRRVRIFHQYDTRPERMSRLELESLPGAVEARLSSGDKYRMQQQLVLVDHPRFAERRTTLRLPYTTIALPGWCFSPSIS